MKVKELMTKNPASCTPETDLVQVAKMMAECNCGAIPVVENKDTQKVVGVVTDRDITVRAVAQNKNPLQLKAQDIMSSPVVTVREDDDLEDVVNMMENKKIRRVPVIDAMGRVSGMVAQADIAINASDQTTASVVEQISRARKDNSVK